MSHIIDKISKVDKAKDSYVQPATIIAIRITRVVTYRRRRKSKEAKMGAL